MTRVLIKNKSSDGLLIDHPAGSIQDRRRENRETSSHTGQIPKDGGQDLQATKAPSKCSKENPPGQEIPRPIEVKRSLGEKITMPPRNRHRYIPRKSSPRKKPIPLITPCILIAKKSNNQDPTLGTPSPQSNPPPPNPIRNRNSGPNTTALVMQREKRGLLPPQKNQDPARFGNRALPWLFLARFGGAGGGGGKKSWNERVRIFFDKNGERGVGPNGGVVLVEGTWA